MSCIICTPETISMLAGIVTDTLNSRQSCLDFDIDGSVFSDCIIEGDYDDHRVYRKLYVENLKAYNSRYIEGGVYEFSQYTPYENKRWSIKEQAEVYKRGLCYLYQISEDATYKKPIYNAIEHFLNTVAGSVAMFYADKNGVPWE